LHYALKLFEKIVSKRHEENVENLEVFDESAELIDSSNISHIHTKYSGMTKNHFENPGVVI
jgi:hypothetical protein